MNMTSKKTLVAAVVLSFSSINAMAADVNSGIVRFSGTVVDTPCNLAPGAGGEDVPVEFGQLSMAQLNTAGQQATKSFSINLENCVLNGKTASIKFDSLNLNTAKTLIIPAGTASGLGIGINGVTFGTERDILGMRDGHNELVFDAVAKKADAADVTAGAFNAVSTFAISYK